MWDSYSDILFTFSLDWENETNDFNRDEIKKLFFVSSVLLVGLLIANLAWLLRNAALWQDDIVVGAKLNGWLRRWRKLLLLLSIMTGNAFGPIGLCNSNLFAYSFFRMGLSKPLKILFDAKRIYLVVILEVEFVL